MQIVKTNDFFDLFQVSAHAFAAISRNKITMSNAGFIDLGKVVVVFDTFLNIDAALELKKCIYELISPEKIIVINSHPHLDHFFGNCMFEDSLIISSEATHKEINHMKTTIKFDHIYDEEIIKLEEKKNDTSDQEQLYDIDNEIIIYKNINNPNCYLKNSQIILDHTMKLYGEQLELSLRLTKKAHSDGDIVGLLEKEKVAFVGDLLFVDEHPFIGAGDPYQILIELESLYSSDIDYFIPGHGPICQKDKILEQIEYINVLIDLIKQHLDEPESITIKDMPEKFQSMNYLTFRWNINQLASQFKNNS